MSMRDEVASIRDRVDAGPPAAAGAPDDPHEAIWEAILLLATRMDVGADFDPRIPGSGPSVVDADGVTPVEGILPHDTPHAVIQRAPLHPPQH